MMQYIFKVFVRCGLFNSYWVLIFFGIFLLLLGGRVSLGFKNEYVFFGDLILNF